MIMHKHLTGGLLVALLAGTQVVGHFETRLSAAGQAPAARRSPGAAEAAPAPAPEYRIGPEDVLDIIVWKNTDLSSRGVQVRPDGRISLSLVNDVQAAGLTPMELRALITKSVATFLEGQEISVVVKEVHSVKISVEGMVKTPNRFELKSQVTVLEAITMAGGFVDFAKRDKIFVLRRDGTRLPFNYLKFMDDPSSKANFLLQAGDIVVVP